MRTPEQKRELTKQRRQAVMSAGVRLPRRRVIPHQLQPTAIERAYYRDIIDLIDITLNDVREKLVPRLPSIIDQYLSETRVDTYGDTISTIFDDLRLGVARTMTDPRARALGDKYAVRTNAFNAQQVDRQFKTVLGISVLREEPWLQPKMGAFSKRNAQLIKSIPEEYLNNLETVVNTAVERGVSTKALEKQILSDMNIKPSEPTIRGARRINPKARARLIARDQIGKYNGSLTKLRQTEIGIEKYIWSTAADDRVRDEHEAINGNTYSWKKGAPELGGANPGDEIQCRCSAIPVMEKFFGEGEVVPKTRPEVPVIPRIMPSAVEYKELKTVEEIEAVGRKQLAISKKIIKSEVDDLQYYRSIGSGQINNYLRVGKKEAITGPKKYLGPTELAELENTTKNIASAIEKSIVPDDVIAYRGFRSKEIVDELNDNIGKVFVEKGFVSTSFDKSIAEQFTGWMTGEGALVKIKVPKGAKGAYLRGREKELLLQKNTKFRIIGKKMTKVKGAKIPIFDLEAVL